MELDAETLARVVLGEGGLRDQYPDDEEFAAAIERLKEIVGAEAHSEDYDAFAAEDWQPFQGPRGGKGWKNRKSGAVVYGAQPGSPEHKQQKTDAQKRVAAKDLETLKDAPKAEVSASHKEAVGKFIAGAFGEGASHDDAPRLIGALGGSQVTLTSRRSWDGKSASISVSGSHPALEHQDRTFSLGEDGSLTCHNDLLFLKKRHRGGGLGMRIFSGQVRELANAGADAIETTAGKGGGMNGYYTWPRLGYDCDLDDDYLSKLPSHAARALVASGASKEDAKARVQKVLAKKPQTVLDLMDSEDGRAIWKATGYQESMKFDLKPGSRSLKVLNEYLASKGKPPIEPDAQKADAAREARKKSAKETVVAANAAEVASRAERGQPQPGHPPAVPTDRIPEFNAVHSAAEERFRLTGLDPAVLRSSSDEVRRLHQSLSTSTLESSRAVANDPVKLRERAYQNLLYGGLIDRNRTRLSSPSPERDAVIAEFHDEVGKLGLTPQQLLDEAIQHGAAASSPDRQEAIRQAMRSALGSLEVRGRLQGRNKS